MKNPALLVPGSGEATLEMWKGALKSSVPRATINLVHLRASQINGCSYCVDIGCKHSREAGETDERLFAVAAWREAPYFTDAERAALALSECVTRLSDRPDPVPDAVWDEAAKHYNEEQLAALLVAIATVNVWNRMNVPTRQPAGSSTPG